VTVHLPIRYGSIKNIDQDLIKDFLLKILLQAGTEYQIVVKIRIKTKRLVFKTILGLGRINIGYLNGNCKAREGCYVGGSCRRGTRERTLRCNRTEPVIRYRAFKLEFSIFLSDS